MRLSYKIFFFLSPLLFYINLYAESHIPPQAAIVVDVKTDEVLYSSNADCKTQPASLTKIMSLFIAFKALKRGKITQQTMMRVSHHAASQKPSSLRLKPGEYISCRNVILAMITKSANDASVVLAEHIAGSEKNFVKIMNREARILRMNSTIFYNASGWKDKRQITTAKDLAKLSKAIMKKFPEFFHLFATKKFIYKNKIYANHNKLLGERGGIKIYGIKTGYVCASGFNISIAASKGKEKIIAIVLGGKTAQKRDAEVEWLISCAFNKLNAKSVRISKKRKSILSRVIELTQKK